MKRIVTVIASALVLCGMLGAQEKGYQYPFQNPNLSMDERLDNLISLMTSDEKAAVIMGQGVPRLGVASTGSTEAIHGIVRGGSSIFLPLPVSNDERASTRGTMVNSTAFPQGYGLGETWDKDMLKLVGEVMSWEARYYSQEGPRNVLCLWAPNADIARDPRWGRTEESFGEDPFLVGELVAAETKGIQGDNPEYWRGAAVFKHFLANSNEDGRDHTDSQFDDALFRDYYSYGFWRGVKNGGGRSLMTAYNKYNGTPCSNCDFINDILIGEWGMDGMILNDGGALGQLVTSHHVAKDMNEAVKLSLEAGVTRFLSNYLQDIKNAYAEGVINDEMLDKNIRFNLRTALRLGLLDDSEKNPYHNIDFGGVAPWETQEHKDAARLVSQKSVVLLKNEGNILPLDKKQVKKIAVMGNRAQQVLADWYGARPSYTVSPLDGLKAAVAGEDVEVRFQAWDRGTGEDLAKWADVCIVCVGNDPNTSPDWGKNTYQAPWGYGTAPGDGRESVDRKSLQLDSEDFIKLVRRNNPNTIVCLISSFPFAINWTAANVPGIIHMTQCSQELGNALADVIFGNYNPAGRTNQTWVKDITDLPTMLDYNIRNGRTYMYFKGKPLYPFGYGLSYTTFKYSKFKVKKAGDNYVIKFRLKNTGKVAGEEVVQFYAKTKGDDAIKRLRGFERISLGAGETKDVEMVIPVEDLKLWSLDENAFVLNKGRAKFEIGASSADIRLRKYVRI